MFCAQNQADIGRRKCEQLNTDQAHAFSAIMELLTPFPTANRYICFDLFPLSTAMSHTEKFHGTTAKYQFLCVCLHCLIAALFPPARHTFTV